MPVLQIIRGQSAYIDPQSSYADSGWVISGKYATHGSCYSGYMEYVPNIPFVDGELYDFTYTVDNYVIGGVRVDMGSTQGTLHSASGTYTETFEYNTGDTVKFYSDGALRVVVLKISKSVDVPLPNSLTFSFNEVHNKWGSDYSYVPEVMLKFSDRFFSFKNGQLWEHDTNPLRNNFYNTQYSSKIYFIANVEFMKDKLWQNIRLDANGKWFAPSITTAPTNQFPNGMYTRLKKNNLKLIDGKLWGPILRDISDPNFAAQTAAVAVYNARIMQGGWLIVNMECEDQTSAQISSLELYYFDTERSL